MDDGGQGGGGGGVPQRQPHEHQRQRKQGHNRNNNNNNRQNKFKVVGSGALQLKKAAVGGDLHTLAQLVQAKVDLNISTDRQQWRALHHAAFHGRNACLEFLVSSKAHLQVRSLMGVLCVCVCVCLCVFPSNPMHARHPVAFNLACTL